MDDESSPRKRRRGAPQPMDGTIGSGSSPNASGSSPSASTSAARATRRSSARATRGGRVSYAPAYPELDEMDDEEQGLDEEVHHGNGTVNDDDDDDDQADNEAEEPSSQMRPQRSRRSVRGAHNDAADDDEAALASTPGRPVAAATQRPPSSKKRVPTGRPRGRPRKDASLAAVKKEAPPSDAMDTDNDGGIDGLDDGADGRRRSVRSQSHTSTPSKRHATADREAPRKRRVRSREEAYAGWIEEVETEEEAREVYVAILTRVRDKLAEEGNSTATDFLEGGAADPSNSGEPLSLQTINERATSSAYESTIAFEKDMLQLFEKGRRHFAIGTREYGIIAVLQRMYNHITQSVDAVFGDIDDDVKARNYSSVRYGPCQNPSEEERYGESPALAAKTPAKLRYKGRRIVTGNWVHLSNPSDPSRPIVAQVFKTRSEDLGNHNQDWVTACWFLRPEQTRHPASMQFWENEVVKTTMLIEHHIEDVLEFICVMHPTKYILGTPADGEGGWHTGDPLYVCEYRYNVEHSLFTSIKNWKSGMPEDTKSKRFDMVEYDEPVAMPEKQPSPFVRGIKGPGELVSESQLQAEAVANNALMVGLGDNAAAGIAGGIERAPSTAIAERVQVSSIPMLFKEWSDEMRAQKRFYKRQRKEQAAREAEQQRQDQHQPHLDGRMSHSPLVQKASSPATTQSAEGLPAVSPVQGRSSSADQGSRATPLPRRELTPRVAQTTDRSLMHAMNQMPDASGFFKPLSEQAQQLFQQDPETGSVLWHAAPPTAGPSLAHSQRKWNGGERFQAHSLDYLYKLATSGPASHAKAKRQPSALADLDADVSMGEAETIPGHEPHLATQDALPLPFAFSDTKGQDPRIALRDALHKAGKTLSERHGIVAEHV